MTEHSLGRDDARPSHDTVSPRFTPGPWHEHSHRQIGPDAGIICEVWSAIGWGDAAISEADANVRLIAAAPDLYAALAAVVAESVVVTNEGGGFHMIRSRIIDQARAVLKFAQEGRQ